MILIEHNGETMVVTSTDGYPGCTVLQEDVTLDHEFKKVDSGQLVDDLALAEAHAIEQVERAADAARSGDIGHVRRQVAISLLWSEVQLLKLANATGNVPGDLTERRKMFPTLMAIVALTGNTLAQVATAVENRLWDRVRRIALWEAKLLLGHDAVRAAATVQEKIAAAEAVQWEE